MIMGVIIFSALCLVSSYLFCVLFFCAWKDNLWFEEVIFFSKDDDFVSFYDILNK